jgi:hypothetical protein
VQTIKKITAKAYKYQYGDKGAIKRVFKSPFALSFTADGKTTFKNQVTNEKVKYGTPKATNFLAENERHCEKDVTLLYF